MSLMEIVMGPLGMLAAMVAAFVALDFAASRWGVDSRWMECQPEWREGRDGTRWAKPKKRLSPGGQSTHTARRIVATQGAPVSEPSCGRANHLTQDDE